MDPVKLANHLYSKELITYRTKDDVNTIPILSRYDRASKLINNFEQLLMESSQAESMLLKFCGVLEEMGDPGLQRISQEIKKDIGLIDACIYSVIAVYSPHSIHWSYIIMPNSLLFTDYKFIHLII